MGEGFAFTRGVSAFRGDRRRIVAMLALGSACAACQVSLDLDQYSFAPEHSVAPFGNQPSGGMSGTAGVASSGAMGGASSSSLGGAPAAGGSGGASGSGGVASAAMGGNGGTTIIMSGGSGGGSNSLKVCPDDELLLDDMEDDPAWICTHYGRNQNPWYTFVGSSDDVLSATLSPTPFAYEAIPGGRMGSQRAIHVVMSTLDANDFAGFGANFSFTTVSLPFDASGYGGLSLYARGSGSLLLRLTSPETIPVAAGGRCVETIDEPCYNDHNVVLELTDTWQLYQYSFADFMPADYGPPRSFSAAELFGLLISPAPNQTELDIWIDDIWFLPGVTAE